jgi:hypothetical protein
MSDAERIEYYRDWMRRLLMGLFTLAGFAPTGVPIARMSAPAQRRIGRLLLPLESAARRLIFLVERRLPETPAPKPKPGPSIAERSRLGFLSKNRRKKKRKRVAPQSTPRAAVFWLFDKKRYEPHTADPRRRPPRGGRGPRIWCFDDSDYQHAPLALKPLRDSGDARRLARRLQALFGVLDDVPGQALRLRRLLAMRNAKPSKPAGPNPIRNGAPPGFRHDSKGEEFELLRACHGMVKTESAPPNV